MEMCYATSAQYDNDRRLLSTWYVASVVEELNS